MAYSFQDEIAGLPAIGQVDSAPRSPALPGMLAHGVDPADGGGEFVYLQGVASVAKGSIVTYAQGSAAALAAVAAHGSPVAVAMAAIGAGQFGWFQVSGLARIAKTAVAFTVGHAVAVSSTAGSVLDAGAPATPLASGTLDGAVVAAAALSGDATAACQLSRPTIA